MSLRLPQKDSLELLSKIMQITDLSKNTDRAELLQEIKKLAPTVKDFERDFPSLTFALATGVGKTRLMGAFISYLYANYGIKNFMVVAPGLTIYEKLKQDFTDTTSEKYVFHGIDIFTYKPPHIITGETYRDIAPGQSAFEESVKINIFNIGKVNEGASKSKGKAPLMRRSWEVLGQSYFDYLAGCDDLVMLMDESHHYRADAGMKTLNDLKPLLGLELTATPKTGKTLFKNVAYEFSLAKAMKYGYVKEPAVATRENFDPRSLTDEQLEDLKINDGIKYHRATKHAVERYWRTNSLKRVNPFVMVVCKDIAHANAVKTKIEAADFFDGYYNGKISIVHSEQKGAEKEENVARLVALDNEDSNTEIVIHVGMLKEGWDVKSLFTIIPLRAIASDILLEQTLGRGLRLPYGQRTGDAFVDRVTVILHDRFDKLIDAARTESSIIRAENIIKIDDLDLDEDKEIVVSQPSTQALIVQAEGELSRAKSQERIEALTQKVEALKVVDQVVTEAKFTGLEIAGVKTQITEATLSKPEVKKEIERQATERLLSVDRGQLIVDSEGNNQSLSTANRQLSLDDLFKIVGSVTAEYLDNKIKRHIDIPHFVQIPISRQAFEHKNFDLEVGYNFSFSTVDEKLLIKHLREEKRDDSLTVEIKKVTDIDLVREICVIINQHPDVHFDKIEDLILKLVKQAIAYIAKNSTGDDETKNKVLYNKKSIAAEILGQLFSEVNYRLIPPEYESKLKRASMDIKPHNYSKFTKDQTQKLSQKVLESELRMKLFGGMNKACHEYYKFDSTPEKQLAEIMDNPSSEVIKWLRPAPKQFNIVWQGSSEYEPDFVVETTDKIFIIEVKRYLDRDTKQVELKSLAAQKWCDVVNNHPDLAGGKPWEYILIMDRSISKNMTFTRLVEQARLDGGK